MYKLITISFILLSFFSNAQDPDIHEGKSQYRPGIFWFLNGFNSPKKGQKRKYDRLMVDVLYNDWVGDVDPFKNSAASIGANFYWMSDIQFSPKSTASFGIGVCYGFWNIRHNNSLSPNSITQESIYQLKNSSDTYKRSALKGHVFSVPVEFRFRTKGIKHFKVHLGFKFGYQLDIHNRYVYDDYKEKVFLKDDNNWVYSTYIRIGIRNFAIYAGYNINTLLKNNTNFNQNHIQMGLTVSLM